MQRNATQDEISTGEVLKLAGIFTTIFSLLIGLVVFFVLPVSCSAVTGLLLLFSIMFLICGIVMWVVGKIKGN